MNSHAADLEERAHERLDPGVRARRAEPPTSAPPKIAVSRPGRPARSAGRAGPSPRRRAPPPRRTPTPAAAPGRSRPTAAGTAPAAPPRPAARIPASSRAVFLHDGARVPALGGHRVRPGHGRLPQPRERQTAQGPGGQPVLREARPSWTPADGATSSTILGKNGVAPPAPATRSALATAPGVTVPRAAPGAAVGAVPGRVPDGAPGAPPGSASASLRASRSTSATGSPNRASAPLTTWRGFWLPCRSTSILARNRLAKSSRWSDLSTP